MTVLFGHRNPAVPDSPHVKWVGHIPPAGKPKNKSPESIHENESRRITVSKGSGNSDQDHHEFNVFLKKSADSIDFNRCNGDSYRKEGAIVSTPALHPTVQAAQEWLRSPIAKARARKLLSTSGFPVGPEELCQETLSQIWIVMHRHPDKVIENIEAYCQTVMRTLCIHASKATFPTLDDDEESDPISEALGSEPIPGETNSHDRDRLLDLEVAALCRSAIETIDGDPDVKATVLNYLTLSMYPDTDCSGLPHPQRGANIRQARWWPAIALALRTSDLFPGDTGSTAAQRQKLRRFVRQCQELIDRAYAESARKDLNNG